MIGYIEGYVIDYSDGWAIISTTSGLGYEVKVGVNQCPPIGAPTKFWIDHAFTQDAQRLYGYKTAWERSLSYAVGKTDKVGPSIAHAIVTTVGAANLFKMVSGVISHDEIKVKGVSADKMRDVVAQLKKAKLDGVEAAVGDSRIVDARKLLIKMGHTISPHIEQILNELAESLHGVATSATLVSGVLERLRK